MIEELNNTYNFILASKSPRRQRLLKELGIDFKIRRSSLSEEIYYENEDGTEVACRLAREKADNTDIKEDKELIITADTVVMDEGQILGKPGSYSEAFQMLKRLSGSSHYVITGICLKDKNSAETFSAETVVHFTVLDDSEIRNYIERYKPFDKAGAYGIQEWIGFIGIDNITGSYYNVVGLPVQLLYSKLKEKLSEKN